MESPYQKDRQYTIHFKNANLVHRQVVRDFLGKMRIPHRISSTSQSLHFYLPESEAMDLKQNADFQILCKDNNAIHVSGFNSGFRLKHYSKCYKWSEMSGFHMAAGQTSMTPDQAADAYLFPPPARDIKDYTIGLIELGGGYQDWDIQWYCAQLQRIAPQLSWQGVDGAINQFFLPDAADAEVQSDICVAAVCLPGVKIIVFFAPNSDQGFINAIDKASSMIPGGVMSISWGAPEDAWDPGAREAMDAAFERANKAGIAVYVASGDNGSDDGMGDGANHVDFPASSPFVTGVGGTRLLLSDQNQRASEKAWSSADGNGATGGGTSQYYPALSVNLQPDKRAVPDIAANADPVTGYQVKVDYLDQVIGGTSLAAPLMASLHLLAQTYFNASLGDIKDVLYQLNADEKFDVVEGENGAFSAGPGYDCCTGIGVPIGSKLVDAIKRVRGGFQ